MVEMQTERGFYFVGERLWLDFVNTEAIENGDPVDLLGGFDDLMTWSVGAQLITAAQARELSRRWSGTPEAARAFTQAVAFRAALRKMAERIAAGRSPLPQATLDGINDVLRARTGELELVRTSAGFEMRFRPRFSEPAHLLVPIAESVADVVSRDNLALLKKCQNPQCVLYFYDTTKNHARRWCSMTACGNRAKAAAHYRRTRAT